MKHFYFPLLCVAAMAISSCSHSIYPLESMYANYTNRMRSPEELTIKSNVWIYFNEKDIPGEYNIISSNTYNPFSLLPFKSIKVKKMNKKFLSEAVKQADKQGGNAILVKAAGFYYVLTMTDRDGVEAPVGNFTNPIFDMKYADMVASPEIQSMKRREATRTVNAFMDEIDSNIEYIQDQKELASVRKKIDVLSQYNLKAKSPKKAIDKFVRKKTRKLNSIEKKMAKQAAKQAKEASKNSKKK